VAPPRRGASASLALSSRARGLSSGTLIFLELALVAGLVLGFGARELLSLRRYREQQRAAEAAKTKNP
jgi:hypothetical protein